MNMQNQLSRFYHNKIHAIGHIVLAHHFFLLFLLSYQHLQDIFLL